MLNCDYSCNNCDDDNKGVKNVVTVDIVPDDLHRSLGQRTVPFDGA